MVVITTVPTVSHPPKVVKIPLGDLQGTERANTHGLFIVLFSVLRYIKDKGFRANLICKSETMSTHEQRKSLRRDVRRS